MPELPEVETICRALTPLLQGQTIRKASISRKKLRLPYPHQFTQRLAGKHINTLKRRGKYILLKLAGEEILLIHLGMSGRFIFDKGSPRPPHCHFSLALENGTRIFYCDPRRFGFITLLAQKNLPQHPALAALGHEPFAKTLTPALLQKRWGKSARAIKALLLDQTPIAGLGNIYASEALFEARLSPLRQGRTLALAELAQLLVALRKVLRRAIKAGGSTLKDYATPTGLTGRFQFQFKTYGRAGEPCFVCQTAIRRIVQNTRASFFCPACQS